ncbi:MAG: IS5 family transposase [Myxococcaceae bacterium]|nr:IS5 family transposase [Myxococcaceae bacterium]
MKPLLPPEQGRRGKPSKVPTRTFLNAIFYIAKTGAPWRDLPERFGPWQTIHQRFSRWNAKGIFDKILNEFAKDADHESNIADGSYAKAHQDAAGGKGGPKLRVLAALAEALPPKSTLLWTGSVIHSTSISRRETFTTSPKLQRLSNSPKAKTSSATKATTQTPSSKLLKRKG